MKFPKIGVLGGGQLGRMMALAGMELGLQFRFWDPSPESCVRHLGEIFTESFQNTERVAEFCEGLDVVTYEFENVPVALVEAISKICPVHPGTRALAVSQDRLHEKNLFRSMGIPTTDFRSVTDYDSLDEAYQEIKGTTVLKTRRYGYDGKGQHLIHTVQDIHAAWEALGKNKPLILEKWFSYDRELSIIAVRHPSGQILFYPLVENHHRDGILRMTIAPAPEVNPALQELAQSYAKKVLEETHYVGVLAIEFFQKGNELVVNEMAPRVHNSGHWTIEGAKTSQFENHTRAVLGLPLGPTQAQGYSLMINILGDSPGLSELLQETRANVHLYGKSPRPSRKLGHINFHTHDADEFKDMVQGLKEEAK